MTSRDGLAERTAAGRRRWFRSVPRERPRAAVRARLPPTVRPGLAAAVRPSAERKEREGDEQRSAA